MSYRSDVVDTRYVDGRAARFGYRRLGPRTGAPLILAHRFRGTIDHWDPAFLDVLSERRDTIVFDNRGTGLSSGAAADTVEGMADGLLEFADALGLPEIDLLGWSMGGYVAQAAALARPGYVRRLVVASCAPGLPPGMTGLPADGADATGHIGNDDADVLFLFFPETPKARELGIAFLRRLDTRLAASHASVDETALRAQVTALGSTGNDTWDRLDDLTLPVLVGYGAHDVMINSNGAHAMAQRLPDAKVIIYSDAGHGFLFQHPEDFGAEVVRFLD